MNSYTRSRAWALARAIGVMILFLALFIGGMWLTKVYAQDMALGDSIAQSTGSALGVPTYAEVGASSCRILGTMPTGFYNHVVISAGINDAPGACVDAIREKVRAKFVTWIVPAPINSAYSHVINVAAAHGDRTVGYLCWHGCTKWNFHPASPGTVANQVRAIWNDQH